MKLIGDCNHCGTCCDGVVLGFRNRDEARYCQLHLGGILARDSVGYVLFIHAPCQARVSGRCIIHDERPHKCRDWPEEGDDIPPQCGLEWVGGGQEGEK